MSPRQNEKFNFFPQMCVRLGSQGRRQSIWDLFFFPDSIFSFLKVPATSSSIDVWQTFIC